MGKRARSCVACAAAPCGDGLSRRPTSAIEDGPCDSLDCRVGYDRRANADECAHALDTRDAVVDYFEKAHASAARRRDADKARALDDDRWEELPTRAFDEDRWGWEQAPPASAWEEQPPTSWQEP